jgi:hypothetical protein
MQKSGPKAVRFEIADLIGALASLVIVVAGSMYLASYSEEVVYLTPFGLSPEMFDIPVQLLIAQGAISLTYFSILIVLLGAAAVLLGFSIRLMIELRATKNGVFPQRWSDRSVAFLRHCLFVLGLLTIMTAAPTVGNWIGRGQLAATQNLLQHHCSAGCFTYSTESGDVIGIKIVADPNRIAVATTSGVRLIEHSSLQSVTPYLPQS